MFKGKERERGREREGEGEGEGEGENVVIEYLFVPSSFINHPIIIHLFN